jgi:hypothetical protein
MHSISQSPDKLNRELSENLPRFRWLDSLLIVILIAGAALTFPTFNAAAPSIVTVYRDNDIIATYPLNEDRTFEVTGRNGPVRISIRANAVSIDHANCPHGICMKTGAVNRPNAQIVCAPNHIIVTTTSNRTDTPDAVAR